MLIVRLPVPFFVRKPVVMPKVLLLASVKSVFYFGLLTVATTSAALLADLVITPALILATTRSGRSK